MRKTTWIAALAVLTVTAANTQSDNKVVVTGSIQSDILIPQDDEKIGTEHKAFEEFHVYWENFIAANSKAPKAEALLPVAASDIIAHGKGIIKFFNSSETWFGMTYPEDRQLVKDEIAKKIRDGYYPEKLWEN